MTWTILSEESLVIRQHIYYKFTPQISTLRDGNIDTEGKRQHKRASQSLKIDGQVTPVSTKFEDFFVMTLNTQTLKVLRVPKYLNSM